MKDIIKKSMLIGLGAASYAQEQTRKHVKDAIKNKKIDKVAAKSAMFVLNQLEKNSLIAARLANKELKKALRTVSSAKDKRLHAVKKKLDQTLKNLEKKGAKTIKKL